MRGKGQPGADCSVSVLFLLQAAFLDSSQVTCSNQDGLSSASPIIGDGSPELPEVVRPPTRCTQKHQELRPWVDWASVAVGARLDTPWVPEGQVALKDEGSVGAVLALLPSNGSNSGPLSIWYVSQGH